MESEITSTAYSIIDYVDSPATVEGCETTSAREGLVQESNVDLPMRASPTSQHPASDLKSPTPRPKHRSLTQLAQLQCHRNWRTGLEVGILTGMILVVWALFSIPTILYALPPIIREVLSVQVNY